VETHFNDYVIPELENLKHRAEVFEKEATSWYRVVNWMLGSGALFALYRSIVSSIPDHNITWQEVVRSIASNLIVVGLLGAMARFAFVMGKSFMVESIRNNNRRHAISFGEFYLKAFGDKVTWSEAKDAFRSWNIDIGSSFLTQRPGDVDPEFIQNLATILSAMGKKVGENK